MAHISFVLSAYPLPLVCAETFGSDNDILAGLPQNLVTNLSTFNLELVAGSVVLRAMT